MSRLRIEVLAAIILPTTLIIIVAFYFFRSYTERENRRVVDEAALGSVLSVNSRIEETYRAEIEDCRKTALQKTTDLRGTVGIKYTIDPDGHVEKPGIKENTTGNELLGSCVLGKVSHWKFAGAGTRVLVHRKFNFSKSPEKFDAIH